MTRYESGGETLDGQRSWGGAPPPHGARLVGRFVGDSVGGARLRARLVSNSLREKKD